MRLINSSKNKPNSKRSCPIKAIQNTALINKMALACS